MARRPYDWFSYGMREAQQPVTTPGWLTILAPVVQGLSQGTQRGIGLAAAAGKFDKGPTMTPGTPAAAEGPEQLFSESPQGHQPSVPYTAVPGTGRNFSNLTPEQKKMLLQLIMSSQTLKDNISRADERRSLREVLATPTYRYRYLDEPEGSQDRIGPMAEEVPERWQAHDPESGLTMIKMPVYLGALHAATRALARDVRSLQEQMRG